MASCYDVANYFLARNDPEVGDLISNLKLQKMVYYAQGFSLAVLGGPLFSERIEAWDHGPVVLVLYHAFKKHGAGPIPQQKSLNEAEIPFTMEQLELLNEVHFVYGQFSAWKLRNMTHEETPWQDAFEEGSAISPESMREYFQTLVEDS